MSDKDLFEIEPNSENRNSETDITFCFGTESDSQVSDSGETQPPTPGTETQAPSSDLTLALVGEGVAHVRKNRQSIQRYISHQLYLLPAPVKRYHSISDPPKLASEHLQSTPIQTSKGQCTSTCILPTQPDLSEISASGSNDGTSEIADMEDLHIFPSAKLLKKKSGMVKRKSLSLRHFQKDLSKREEKQRLSCFINPFELTVYSSEEEVSDDDGSSDSDYEPSFNISIGPPKEKGDSDVELGDLVFDLAENEDVDDSETEDHGAGIMKISCPDDAKILTDDQLYLVYLQPLLNLAALQIDPVCNVKLCSSIVKPTTNVRGSAIYIIWVCEKGHQIYKWCSQPVLNRRLHGGDLLISAAILFSGNNYNKVKLFSKFLRLPIVSISSFNLIQRTYLVPSVDEMWAEKQENVLSQFDGQDVVILGDGRMDSPGHCAQYCTYTVMEESTKKILSCITLDKRQCGGKSANLEKLGFMNSMVKLSENSVRVVEVVTDAHVQISSVMSKCTFTQNICSLEFETILVVFL